MDVYSNIQQLLHKAMLSGMLGKEDELYARNKIMDLLALQDFYKSEVETVEKDISDLLDELTEYAVKTKVIGHFNEERDILSAKMMDIFLPKPSELNRFFFEKYEQNPKRATDYFYQLSKDSHYIQSKRNGNNIQFSVETEYGKLALTINLSKPELDPMEIAWAREQKSLPSTYPKCMLCIENEGYSGRVDHPARSNHRLIRLQLTDEPWYFHYSPYSYYPEHCIVYSGEHREMRMGRETFQRLFEFVDQFPHYFIGSNADLPIIGGSIFSHDHYQGGQFEFALEKAENDLVFEIPSLPSVNARTVKWPMSVIRLSGMNVIDLIDASSHIFEIWQGYSDSTVNIEAYSCQIGHNSVTPIARKRNDVYEMDLVLRNNRTTAEFPFGIFHPHEELHHIKKENIGLIEVLGLAVLPPRLKQELLEVEKYLLREPNVIQDYHLPWANEIKARFDNQMTQATVRTTLCTEVGQKFLKCLEDAGVFKRNEEGQQAFRRFLHLI
ncbi:UDP-glucose--hexose-1-phosphate uridylyltransferase [Bacillus cihuensis]|uniref:UDP-glucose--hexose-1-phosphate uridylyltransferase n=1 Tax=Bacillus cihuensis TaxID=1208599 RepID=UPI000408CC13|nr:UDP-glucose--hexose-1-phosphate uridylyltransferase [Bacillus cihuensis]